MHDQSLIDQFWENIEKTGGCWVWTGTKVAKDYARLGTERRRPRYAHRFSYELHKGPIPEGLEIDHLCRNTLCVNPDHLEAVTHAENLRRSPTQPTAINARKTHCLYGHPFSGDNLFIDSLGKRVCRACRQRRDRERRQRKRESQLALL